jgi:hypothetical protein
MGSMLAGVVGGVVVLALAGVVTSWPSRLRRQLRRSGVVALVLARVFFDIVCEAVIFWCDVGGDVVPVVRQEAVLYCDRGCAMRMVMCDVQSVGVAGECVRHCPVKVCWEVHCPALGERLVTTRQSRCRGITRLAVTRSLGEVVSACYPHGGGHRSFVAPTIQHHALAHPFPIAFEHEQL